MKRKGIQSDDSIVKEKTVSKIKTMLIKTKICENISGSQSESRKAQSGFGKWSSLTDGHNAKTVLQLLPGMATYKGMHGERIDV